jgi:hypothetical protein
MWRIYGQTGYKRRGTIESCWRLPGLDGPKLTVVIAALAAGALIDRDDGLAD